MPFNFLITNAGWAKIAQVGTLGPVVLDRIQVGASGYTPAVTQTTLVSPIKNLTIVGSTNPNNKTIHITAQDNTSDAYVVNEVGLFTPDNTLFAVYSNTSSSVAVKAAGSLVMVALDLVLDNVTPGSVVVGDTGFSYPQATELMNGTAKIATTADVNTGTNDTEMVTPLKLKEYLDTRQATTTVRGTAQIATSGDMTTGTDDTKIVTPAKLLGTPLVLSRIPNGLITLPKLSDSGTWSDNVQKRLAKAWINFCGIQVGAVPGAFTGGTTIAFTNGSPFITITWPSSVGWTFDYLGCFFRIPTLNGSATPTVGGVNVYTTGVRIITINSGQQITCQMQANATSTGSVTVNGANSTQVTDPIRASYGISGLTKSGEGYYILTLPAGVLADGYHVLAGTTTYGAQSVSSTRWVALSGYIQPTATQIQFSNSYTNTGWDRSSISCIVVFGN